MQIAPTVKHNDWRRNLNIHDYGRKMSAGHYGRKKETARSASQSRPTPRWASEDGGRRDGETGRQDERRETDKARDRIGNKRRMGSEGKECCKYTV